jgi:hypothetical protein
MLFAMKCSDVRKKGRFCAEKATPKKVIVMKKNIKGILFI